MTETLSIRIDANTKARLDVLAQRSQRSRSFLAAQAISRYVDDEEWQVSEIEAGIADVDAGRTVDHDKVAAWLKTWGSAAEGKPPL